MSDWDEFYSAGCAYEGFRVGEADALIEADEIASQERMARLQKLRFLNELKRFRRNYRQGRRTDALALELVRMGYLHVLLSGSTWREGYLKEREDGAIFVLFRRSGIDVRGFRGRVGYMFDDSGLVRFSGGVILRMDYSKVEFSVMSAVRFICMAEVGDVFDRIDIFRGVKKSEL